MAVYLGSTKTKKFKGNYKIVVEDEITGERYIVAEFKAKGDAYIGLSALKQAAKYSSNLKYKII